jgi:hypothetical protein
MQKILDFSSHDLRYIGYKTLQQKKLDADKMRRHILECMGIYVSILASNYKHDESIEYKIEAAKSKIFLSAVRDIAADSLLGEQADSVFSVRSKAIRHLIRNGVLKGPTELQIESVDGNWLPLHWSGLVDGISADDVRPLLGGVTTTVSGSEACAIHYAVASHRPNFPIIRAISSPCSFLREDISGKLPIHWAASMSRDIEVLKYLVEKYPISIEKCDKFLALPHCSI